MDSRAVRKADFRAKGGFLINVGGSLTNIKARKDTTREGLRPRIGVSKDP